MVLLKAICWVIILNKITFPAGYFDCHDLKELQNSFEFLRSVTAVIKLLTFYLNVIRYGKGQWGTTGNHLDEYFYEQGHNGIDDTAVT